MLHKHTHSVLTLINDFFQDSESCRDLHITHCVFDAGNRKKLDNIALELNWFKENDDYSMWSYSFYFAIMREKYVASQNVFFELANVLKALCNKVEVNVNKMSMNITIMEKRCTS